MGIPQQDPDYVRDMLETAKKHKTPASGGFWKPEEGANYIRILPPVGNMKFFFVAEGRHYVEFDDGEKKNIVCIHETSGKELDCPLCEFSRVVYSESEDVSKKYRVKKQFNMNVIVRQIETGPDGLPVVVGSEGPLPFTPGPMIFGGITDVVGDPVFGDVSDPQSGVDLVITKSITGDRPWDIEYEVRPYLIPGEGGTLHPVRVLSEDPEEVEAWLSEARDHSSITENLPSRPEVIVEGGLETIFPTEVEAATEADES